MADSATTMRVWKENADAGGDDGLVCAYTFELGHGRGDRVTYLCEDDILLAEKIEDSLLDKPGLGNLGEDVFEEDLEDYFADDETLGLGSIVLLWQTGLEDVVDYLTHVLRVNGSVGSNSHVRLKAVEEDREREGGAAGVRGGEFGRSIAIVAVMLSENSGDVAEDEGG
jgi:hypothetical protein